MIIELPYPNSDLSPNKRLHWSKVAKAKKQARNVGNALTRASGGYGKLTAPIHVSITMYPPDMRRRDDDNAIASFKAYRDGIADALGVDDADWETTYRFKREPLGKVIVEVSEPFEVPFMGQII